MPNWQHLRIEPNPAQLWLQLRIIVNFSYTGQVFTEKRLLAHKLKITVLKDLKLE